MTKNEELKSRIIELLQPYLDENYVDAIPNNRRKLVEDIAEDAEYYESYEDVICILENNKEEPFNDVLLKIVSLYPSIEIVDDDVDVYEDDEEQYNYGNEEYKE